MKTLGYTKVALLPLMILVTTTGLFTASPILAQEGNILEENTLYRKENLKEAREELRANQTGSDIMEALTILNEILEKLEKTLSEEKSSLSTQLLEK
jgi:hypothetical protein